MKIDDPQYYCVKSFFDGTRLTMSVNVLKEDNITKTFVLALRYFTKECMYNQICKTITKLELYENESSMHSSRNLKATLTIEIK